MEFSHTGLNASKLIFFGTVTPAARLYISVEKTIMFWRVEWGKGVCVQNLVKISTHTLWAIYATMAWPGSHKCQTKIEPCQRNTIFWPRFCMIKYWTIAPPVWEPLYTWWWSQMEEGWVGLLKLWLISWQRTWQSGLAITNSTFVDFLMSFTSIQYEYENQDLLALTASARWWDLARGVGGQGRGFPLSSSGGGLILCSTLYFVLRDFYK